MLWNSKSEVCFYTASALLRAEYHNGVYKCTGYPLETGTSYLLQII